MEDSLADVQLWHLILLVAAPVPLTLGTANQIFPSHENRIPGIVRDWFSRTSVRSWIPSSTPQTSGSHHTYEKFNWVSPSRHWVSTIHYQS